MHNPSSASDFCRVNEYSLNLPTHVPSSPEEAASIIREAEAKYAPVFIRGGGTKRLPALGLSGVILDTRNLKALIDFPARDMTITVQAGMKISELQQLLNTENLELPVDVPLPGEATVGGCLAANTAGPRRYTRGTLRDYLIGITFISDEGKLVNAGGRVVKNVAGYDLMKMHIGAQGTLGIITQATFKVFPKYPTMAWVLFSVGTAALAPTLDRLHTSNARPAIIDVLNHHATRQVSTAFGQELPSQESWLVCVGFEEKTVTVAKQVEVLEVELRTSPVKQVTTITGEQAATLLQHLTQSTASESDATALRLGVVPSKTASTVLHTASFADWNIHAHAGNGIIYLSRADQVSASELLNLKPSDGTFQVLRGIAEPAALAAMLPGREREWALMKTLKQTLDPQDIFNPGRIFPASLRTTT